MKFMRFVRRETNCCIDFRMAFSIFPIVHVQSFFISASCCMSSTGNEIPEFKIPWLIILFLLPVIGAFIYMLFTSTGQSKKEYQKFEDVHRRLLPYMQQPEVNKFKPVFSRIHNNRDHRKITVIDGKVGVPHL